LGNIAYFDIQDGDSSGHIRCEDAASAAAIVQTPMPGCSLELLMGSLKSVHSLLCVRSKVIFDYKISSSLPVAGPLSWSGWP